jgi:hypothetical protein
MNKWLLTFVALMVSATGSAHVTPNVQLIRRGDFIKAHLPGATQFFEKTLMIGGPDMAAIKKATGWTPSEEDARIYIGRDALGKLAGSVAFIWMPSEHGPVGIGVAFDPDGTIIAADVTDVGTEPLAWVRPLLEAHGLDGCRGLRLDQAPEPAKIAPGVNGQMNRYYAEVIANGVERAQSLERVSHETPPSR